MAFIKYCGFFLILIFLAGLLMAATLPSDGQPKKHRHGRKYAFKNLSHMGINKVSTYFRLALIQLLKPSATEV